MPNHAIQTKSAPTPAVAYSQARQIGPFLQVSGQLPVDPSTGRIEAKGIQEQTNASLANVSAQLSEAGASWSDVLITRVYLSADEDFDGFDSAYTKIVPPPYPARVTVGAALAPGALVEIDALALLPPEG